MIVKIKGQLTDINENKAIVCANNIFYEIFISSAVAARLKQALGKDVEIPTYYYLQADKNKSIPALIGFADELEKEFFEKFITVSGIGPKAAVRALQKPISLIAKAIDEGDVVFLKSLPGIGTQRAKQIIAHLQGKTGKFALMKAESHATESLGNKEMIENAKQILKRLQYSQREIENMLASVLKEKSDIDSVEELLTEIYRRNKQ